MVSSISTAALLLQVVRAVIVPEQQSIIWKYEGKNFWASLDLNVESFALESPAGSAPDALARRGAGGEYQACTVLTLDGEVTEAALQGKVAEYQKLNDDVWSASQVCYITPPKRSELTFGSSVSVSLYTPRSTIQHLSTSALSTITPTPCMQFLLATCLMVHMSSPKDLY